jgi:protein-disulfide isomerase
MTDQEDIERTRRAAEAVKAKEKEGFGTVPNVTPKQDDPKTEALKVAAHELEETKGDWAKGH